jgi:hypothetical protein
VLLLVPGCAPVVPLTGLPDRAALLLSTDPADGQYDHRGDEPLTMMFDTVPEGLVVSIDDSLGNPIDGLLSGDPRGVARTFAAEGGFRPDSGFRAQLSWEGGDALVRFGTATLGLPIDEEEDAFLGMTWSLRSEDLFALPLDLGWDVPEAAVLVAVWDGSEPETGFVHLVAAQTVTGSDLQDNCAETSFLTAGDDGVPGTWDDQPANWANPRLAGAGRDFPGSATLRVRGWELDGIVWPQRDGLQIETFRAWLDAGELDGAVPDGAPGDSFCDFAEQVLGWDCDACPDNRHADCVALETHDVYGRTRDTDLRERSCADILRSAFLGFSCVEMIDVYDEDGDGVFEGCPEYVPAGG